MTPWLKLLPAITALAFVTVLALSYGSASLYA
jgi:hypothetical protein